MTVDTVAHLEIAHLLDNLHARHVAMASRAGDPVLNVWSVDELDVIWNTVDPNPVDWLRLAIIVKELCQLGRSSIARRFRAVDLAKVMTEQTLRDCWDGGCLVGRHLAVAELAVDAGVRDVGSVRECDRLRWAVAEAEHRWR